jgi:hypothetical protein
VHEIKAGYNSIEWNYDHNGLNGTFNERPSGCTSIRESAGAGVVPGLLIPADGHAPRILLRGYTLGTGTTHPHCVGENTYQVRDNLTMIYNAAGRHELRVGGEYLHTLNHLQYPQLAYGQIDATGGQLSASDIQQIFPVWNDSRTWNYAALSPVTRFYTKAFADTNQIYHPIDTFAVWLQNDWTATRKLTLNLGVRYDVSLGSIGDRLDPFLPFRPADLIKSDLANVAPRLGFAFAVSDKTVIRGGFGAYYAQPLDFAVYWTEVGMVRVVPTAVNDGRPNFAADPYNGQTPTAASIVASGVRRDVAMQMIDPATYHTQHSYQTSIGLQRQLRQDMSVQADYVYTGSRGEAYVRNANLNYNPATGANYDFRDLSHLPFPQWGLVPMYFGDGYSNYHGFQTAFTKRFSRRWQASATYTLSGLWDSVGSPAVGFDLPADLGKDYSFAVSDQRHRAVFNGIWELGRGFQASGVYFYGCRFAVDGILEVFNVFNHANFGAYTTTEVSPAYGKPNQTTNLPYQPRTVQLAFRLAF